MKTQSQIYKIMFDVLENSKSTMTVPGKKKTVEQIQEFVKSFADAERAVALHRIKSCPECNSQKVYTERWGSVYKCLGCLREIEYFEIKEEEIKC